MFLMPLLAGGALGIFGAFYAYSYFIGDIDAATLSEVTIEYGHPITLDSFFTRVPVNTTFITDINQIDTGKLATYQIFMDCGGHTVSSILKVVDKTAPTATAVPVEMFCGKAPAPETLVTNVFDLTDVKIEYAEGAPDLVLNTGKLTVPVKLTDQDGNSSIVEVPFTVKDDHTPPVITGVKKFEHVAKDKTKLKKDDFLEGVKATDDFTFNPKVEVDSSRVKQEVAGVYPLRYYCTDKAGNRTEVETTVTVYATYNAGMTKARDKKDINEAYRRARNQLDKIVKSSDNEVVKTMKVYYWVYHHIRFSTGRSTYKSWAKAAVQTFKTKWASCYGRTCMCKAFLDVMGIQNISICRKKVGQYRIHYWNLVKLNGGWYHCDVQWYLPGLAPKNFFCFMMTDKEIRKAPTNHNFKKGRYPKSSTKSVQKWVDVYHGKIKAGFPYKK